MSSDEPKIKYYVAAPIMVPMDQVDVTRQCPKEAKATSEVIGEGRMRTSRVTSTVAIPMVGAFSVYCADAGLVKHAEGTLNMECGWVKPCPVPRHGYMVAAIVNNPWTAKRIMDEFNSMPIGEGYGFRRMADAPEPEIEAERELADSASGK